MRGISYNHQGGQNIATMQKCLKNWFPTPNQELGPLYFPRLGVVWHFQQGEHICVTL